MRAIITGGTGMIGSRLSALLGKDGYDVVVLSRNPSEKCQTLPSGVRAIRWDGKTPQGWGHLLDHPDTFIINLAGESIASLRWTTAHKQRVLQSRLDATHAVVAAIQQSTHKPRAFIQASAMGYYGDRADDIITEATPPSAEWRAQVCVDWEAAAANAGVRTAILRIGISLGLGHGALPAFLKAAECMGARLGHGKQWMPWIHNDDVAGAIRFLMNHDGAHGVFNVVAPMPLQNADFMRVVAGVRGRPAMIPVPSWALFLAMGEQALFVLDSQRAIPQALQDAGYKFHFPDAESALRDILKNGRH